jgi:Protein of unknown function (DUF3341)
MLIKEESPLFGVMAEYETPEALIEAATRVREAGYKKMDAYTPFPVEGMSEALGIRDKWILILMLCAGLIGCLNGWLLQYYANVAAYPFNIGGKPIISWPLMVVVMFESTVLTSALTGVFGMFILNGLPELYHPMFGVPGFERASQDRFFLCIEQSDKKFDVQQATLLLEETAALRVGQVAR